MKKSLTFVFAFAFCAIFASTSTAQLNGFSHHFGLSDSCWNVFLSQLPGGDSSIGAYLDSITAIDTQLDSLQKLIHTIKGKGVKDLQAKIKALKEAERDLWKKIHMILAANRAILVAVLDSCGNEVDTTAPPDTTVIDSLTIGGLVPNPATVNTPTTLTYTITGDMHVSVGIFDQGGNLVQTTDLGTQTGGTHTASLDLTGLAPGSYIVRVQADGSVKTIMLVIV
jgi:hypothetical protein